MLTVHTKERKNKGKNKEYEKNEKGKKMKERKMIK